MRTIEYGITKALIVLRILGIIRFVANYLVGKPEAKKARLRAIQNPKGKGRGR